MLVLAISMSMTVARKETAKNAVNNETYENSKRDNYLRTNLI